MKKLQKSTNASDDSDRIVEEVMKEMLPTEYWLQKHGYEVKRR